MAPRPPNERDQVLAINGTPAFLGILVSAGAVINNATTAVPFNDGAAAGRTTTLAGKVLLLQPTAAGVFMPSSSALIGGAGFTLALQSVVPPLANTIPGVSLAAGERVVVTMGANQGWLQWLPLAGAANLFVWELT
jgi:hypothetical protein